MSVKVLNWPGQKRHLMIEYESYDTFRKWQSKCSKIFRILDLIDQTTSNLEGSMALTQSWTIYFIFIVDIRQSSKILIHNRILTYRFNCFSIFDYSKQGWYEGWQHSLCHKMSIYVTFSRPVHSMGTSKSEILNWDIWKTDWLAFVDKTGNFWPVEFDRTRNPSCYSLESQVQILLKIT